MRRSEVERFYSRVVKGPGIRDCWIWTGAISTDGYGRFWIRTGPRMGRVVRPSRLIVALVDGTDIDEPPVVEHEVCDNPICVRYEGFSLTDHLAPSTQAENLRRMAQRGRGGHAPITYRDRAEGRAALAARSRAIRAAVLHGWDDDALAQALRTYRCEDQLVLW